MNFKINNDNFNQITAAYSRSYSYVSTGIIVHYCCSKLLFVTIQFGFLRLETHMDTLARPLLIISIVFYKGRSRDDFTLVFVKLICRTTKRL